MAEEEKFKNQAFNGTPLAEVFSIIIDICGTVKCEIYGTIRVDDCKGSFCMYNVKREESESVTQNESLVVRHGTRAICAENDFTISFDLREKKLGEDVEFIIGHFRWERTDPRRKRIVTNVVGKFGSSAKVEYAVFPGAIEANIWAEFYSEDEVAHSSLGFDLEGRIVLRYKYWDGGFVHDSSDPNKYYEITLVDEGVTELHDNDLIPFHRYIVVLPLGYALSIDVDLKGKNSEGKLATWAFNVQFFAKDITVINSYRKHRGEYGIIKLGCIGFQYIHTLAEVEEQKKYLRESHRLFS